jgi:hypothetical protein
MAGGMYTLLHGVGGEGALLIPDNVVCQVDGTLEARVHLQVEVKVYQGRRAMIHNGTPHVFPSLSMRFESVG